MLSQPVRSIDVDQGRVGRRPGRSSSFSLYQRFEHVVILILTALIGSFVIARVESQPENSVRPRLIRQLRSIGLFGLPGRVRMIFTVISPRVQEIAPGRRRAQGQGLQIQQWW